MTFLFKPVSTIPGLVAWLMCFLSITLSAGVAHAADPIYTSWRNNVAVGGYDPVSFFSGKPLEGKDEFVAQYQGAQWQFSSEANLDLFRTNPPAFIPQYGGYCAWAVANGKLAKGSPQYWLVRDGKLYLNFNDRIQTRWERDIAGFITKADRAWPTLVAN